MGYKRLFDRGVELVTKKRIMSGGAVETAREKCRCIGTLNQEYFHSAGKGKCNDLTKRSKSACEAG